jgi:hypothetical protein
MDLRTAKCSFCGKAQSDDRRLIAGPGVYICNQCVALCNEVLAHDPPAEPPKPPASPAGWVRQVFHR